MIDHKVRGVRVRWRRYRQAMASTPRPGRCWYCAESRLGGGDKREHPLSASIGAEVKTTKVCSRCNQRAGVQIDQPLLEDFIMASARQRAGVLTRRGAAPPGPRMDWSWPDGTPMRLNR